MTLFLILALLVLIAVAAPWLGADSRHLDRYEAGRDALWSRDPGNFPGRS